MDAIDHLFDPGVKPGSRIVKIERPIFLIEPYPLQKIQGTIAVLKVVKAQLVIESGVMQRVYAEGIHPHISHFLEPGSILFRGCGQFAGLSSRNAHSEIDPLDEQSGVIAAVPDAKIVSTRRKGDGVRSGYREILLNPVIQIQPELFKNIYSIPFDKDAVTVSRQFSG